MKTTDEYPIGGSRQAVFDALKSRGFVQSNWSDKHWNRRDGLAVHVYGTGSRLGVYDPAKNKLADGLMANSLAFIDSMDRELAAKA